MHSAEGCTPRIYVDRRNAVASAVAHHRNGREGPVRKLISDSHRAGRRRGASHMHVHLPDDDEVHSVGCKAAANDLEGVVMWQGQKKLGDGRGNFPEAEINAHGTALSCYVRIIQKHLGAGGEGAENL